MSPLRPVDLFRVASRAALVAALLSASASALAASHEHTSGTFAGVKADRGTVTHRVEDGRDVLVLSDDFKVPDAPDPHWQIVDSKGTVYRLDRLIVKPEQTLKSKIFIPAYVPDVAKVQMWCAYAEVLLGEASFNAPIALHGSQRSRVATGR